MLKRVEIANFKGIRRLSIPLEPLTVLVGANGVGKTTVLQAIDRICMLGRAVPGENTQDLHRVSAAFGGPWALGRVLTQGQGALRIALFREPDKGPWIELKASHRADTTASDVELRLGEQTPPRVLRLPAEHAGAEQFFSDPGLGGLGSCVLMLPSAEAMGQPSQRQGGKPRMTLNGQGLPSLILYLRGAQHEKMNAIDQAVQQVIPQYKRATIEPESATAWTSRPFPIGKQVVMVPSEETVPVDSLYIEFKDGSKVPADMVSEGTLLTLGLITALNGFGDEASVLLLDDLDRALHMGAQVRLLRLIRKIQEHHPNLQVITTSHSPLLLQELPYEAVQVLRRSPDGETGATRLDQHPEVERYRAALNAGEFWATFGEDWVNAFT